MEPVQAGAPLSSPPASQPGKTSGLAVTAFILSLIFFLPIVPLIGAILGIISLATFRPDRRGKGLAIAAIPVGLVIAIFLQGMMAAIAIPAFIKFTRKAKAVEATESLDKLSAGARAYVMADHFDQAGNILPKGLPVASTDWVPKAACCGQPENRCAPSPGEWAAEPWKSLHFELSDPHHYQYRYQSDGRTVTIEARSDLDCDGDFSSYKMVGALGEEGVELRGPEIENELE